MSAPATPPIIIIKKKGGHGGHHGGAWKVAYADFVTAMMAFFIVMWLLSSSEDVKKAIQGYFRDPKGMAKQLGSSMGGNGESLTINKMNVDQLKDKLQQAINKSPQFEKLKDFVEMTITGEGLRIELIDGDKGNFFETGQPVPTATGRELLERLARELGKMPNTVLVEGHTDSTKYQSEEYSNWELSADRANAARKIMQQSGGLRPDQVRQVRGFADQQLRVPDKPEDTSNRRITIIVQFPQQLDTTPEPSEAGKEGKEGEDEGKDKSPEGHGESAKKSDPAHHAEGKSAVAESAERHPAPVEPSAEKSAPKMDGKK